MNTSRKAMEWLVCFSIVNLMSGSLLFQKFKNFSGSCSLSKTARMLSTCQHVINLKFRFVKIIFIKSLRFVKTHEDVSEGRSKRRTHGYSINLIIKLTIKNKMSL